MKRAGWIFLMILALFSTPAFPQISNLQKGDETASDKKTASTSEGQSLSDVNSAFLKQRKASMQWGRDPFVLPARPTGEPHQVMNEVDKPFSLNAIIYNNETGAAIINGRIVRKGDQIEGMEVSELHPDRVLLREGLRILELKVDPFLSK